LWTFLSGQAVCQTRVNATTSATLRARREETVAKAPRVVAFGGGTGLPLVLSDCGRRAATASAAWSRSLTTGVERPASPGARGRTARGHPPVPGRARGRRRLAEVFEYRFEGGVNLRDHSVGNIIIAALADMSSGFCEGAQQAARFLRIKGSVQPAATESPSTTPGRSPAASPPRASPGSRLGGSGSSPKRGRAGRGHPGRRAGRRHRAQPGEPVREHHPGAAGRGGSPAPWRSSAARLSTRRTS